MDSQLVDLGGLLAVVGILWRIIVFTKKDLNRHLDHQVEVLKESQAGLKEGQAELKAELRADMKEGQAELKAGQARMEGHVIQLAAGLGEVRGELKRIAPREKVGAGGS